MMAGRVDECFLVTNGDLYNIDRADFLPEMTYIDHLRQKVMSFAFIKRSPRQKSLKNQPIRRILSLALILPLPECFLFLVAKKAGPGAIAGCLPAIT